MSMDCEAGTLGLQVRGAREERFLSAQADAFAGANAEEKASACSVRKDGVEWVSNAVERNRPNVMGKSFQ
jgi:hypothetical protein